MIDGGDLDAVSRELAAHPAHQRGELGLAVETAADTGLVGGDDDGEVACGELPGQNEDAVDEAAIGDAVEIAAIVIDDAVAIEQQPAPAGFRHARSCA